MKLEEEAERIAIMQQMRHKLVEAMLKPMSLEQTVEFCQKEIEIAKEEKSDYEAEVIKLRKGISEFQSRTSNLHLIVQRAYALAFRIYFFVDNHRRFSHYLMQKHAKISKRQEIIEDNLSYMHGEKERISDDSTAGDSLTINAIQSIDQTIGHEFDILLLLRGYRTSLEQYLRLVYGNSLPAIDKRVSQE